MRRRKVDTNAGGCISSRRLAASYNCAPPHKLPPSDAPISPSPLSTSICSITHCPVKLAHLARYVAPSFGLECDQLTLQRCCCFYIESYENTIVVNSAANKEHTVQSE